MNTLIPLTPTIKWIGNQVKLIDQTKLPFEQVYIETDEYQVVCDAIYRLCIRGAPAIGVAGAYACVLAANKIQADELTDFLDEFLLKADEIGATRPTAVNLLWGVNQMKEKAKSFSGSLDKLKIDLLKLAHDIREDDIARCHKLALNGAGLIPQNANVITICNTGGLATSGIGTALGVIQYAHAQKRDLKVHVCETRPLLQGARLNCWELKRTNTPFTLMTDSMAAQTMKNIQINGVFVGADRIAANGDTANKIGTYSLAVLAKHHNIPFYVAAPLSTVDYDTPTGSGIPVEERSPDEVINLKGVQLTIENIEVSTPAFDITPAGLITGIITDKGVANYPYDRSLKRQRNEK
ncbi:MAG: S-methyl-5-thioribose-1-phosphate isomerase [Candidatus Marinimicrobia bacterium]|nr:S-methyl-5-thioribose-1-phosphate isomerase [Candidatus Neomarinimicrobiota bacterium]|tara:strand:- start:32090 stop:33145 length:1056 start_codon:yes stop_codon:yes gene_type:complete